MIETDLNDYGYVVRMKGNGHDVVAEGTLRTILPRLSAHEYGRMGAMGVLLEGQNDPIYGRAMTAWVEAILR